MLFRSVYSASAGVVALPAFNTTVISGNAAGTGNAGYGSSNKFTIRWRAGTTEGSMIGTPFVDLDYSSDRYSTNVYLDISAY